MNNLFYSLEDGKYYTYPDGDEATGIQIREVIEANERSISKLQQETEKLKKQYCERTDCGGRIGNSKKVEELQNENQQLKKVIDKAIEYINGNKDKYYQDWGQDDGDNDIYLGEYEIKELLDILKEVE